MSRELTIQETAERSLIKTYRKSLWNPFIAAVKRYELVEPGDRIAVCISGGKDSMVLAKLMQELQRHTEQPFELTFLVMDPGYNPANRALILENAEKLGIPVQIFESDIFDVTVQVEKNPCYLCARMRRGFLYAKAQELGCNKIALGHHFSDVVETTLLGLFYGAQLQAMPPKLKSRNFPGMELIRPLYCVHEDAIIAWKNYNHLRFLQCACRFTEARDASGDGVGESKRQEMKVLLRQLKKTNPNIEKSIFRAIHGVQLDTFPGFKQIFESDIFDVTVQVEKNPCYLCARMRRGFLYAKAQELGCNKIALGHHFSDVVETTLLGLFYGAQLQAMPPKLKSRNFPGMELIRPLYCVHEDAIIAWKNYNHLRFLQCACRFTEARDASGDGVGESKRQEMKVLLRQLKKTNPNIEKSIFRAIHGVQLDTFPGFKYRGKAYSFLDDYDGTAGFLQP